MPSQQSSTHFSVEHALCAQIDSSPASVNELTKVPSFAMRQSRHVKVLLKPISVLLNSALRLRHRKEIRAQDVRDVVEPDIVGVLIAHRLAKCHDPRSRLEDFLVAKYLVHADLVPANAFVNLSVEAINGRDHTRRQPLTADFEGGFRSVQAQSFARFARLTTAKQP